MGFFKFIREQIGPAIIVAAVVLGPGSILTSSKVGCQYGYSMLWVIIASGILMVGFTALAARLGASLDKTLCGEIGENLGKPASVFIGVVLFLVVAAFQSSNNLAVLAAIEPYITEQKVEKQEENKPAASLTQKQTPSTTEQPVAEIETAAENETAAPEKADATIIKKKVKKEIKNPLLKAGILIGVNLIVIFALFGMKHFYQMLEKMMLALMVVMVVGFGINLLFAAPSISGLFSGLIPSFPEVTGGWLPMIGEPSAAGTVIKVIDPYWAVQGMIGTTFSIAGAFYQAYLVREKGWTKNELSKGLLDSVTGIATLGLVTMMIMCTSAAVLHGKVEASRLKSVTDVAEQLEPLFGDLASLLFILGIFAGAFSSFLINATIGGVLLSDSLGMGASLDQKGPKIFTVIALICGMVVALLSSLSSMDRVALIVFAQALTVLGGPVLAASLIYLAIGRAKFREKVQVPAWMLFLVILGFVIVSLIAFRVAVKVYLTISLW